MASDVTQVGSQTGLKRNFRDNGDATYAEEYSSQLRAWDATSLTWVKLLVDHATGALSTVASGGGGGAATIADGADVAQGSTTDLSSASTVVGLLKAIKAAITGTVSTSAAVSNFPATQAVSSASMPSTPVTGPLTDTQLRATPVPVSGTVTATTGGLTDTQLRATPVPVSGTVTATTGGLTDTQLRATPVPVSGTVATTGGLTDTQLRATPVPVSGTVTATTGGLTDTQLRASAVPVSLATAPTTPVTGTFWQATQPVDPSGVTSPVSVASLPLPSGAATSVSVLDASTRIRELAFDQWFAHEEALFQ